MWSIDMGKMRALVRGAELGTVPVSSYLVHKKKSKTGTYNQIS